MPCVQYGINREGTWEADPQMRLQLPGSRTLMGSCCGCAEAAVAAAAAAAAAASLAAAFLPFPFPFEAAFSTASCGASDLPICSPSSLATCQIKGYYDISIPWPNATPDFDLFMTRGQKRAAHHRLLVAVVDEHVTAPTGVQLGVVKEPLVQSHGMLHACRLGTPRSLSDTADLSRRSSTAKRNKLGSSAGSVRYRSAWIVCAVEVRCHSAE